MDMTWYDPIVATIWMWLMMWSMNLTYRAQRDNEPKLLMFAAFLMWIGAMGVLSIK